MNRKNISAFILASSVFTGLSFNANSASAASLGASCLFLGTASGNYLFNRGTDKDTFKNNCNSTEIGVVEGRAGTAGNTGDYEVGIGLNGAQADLADQLQLDWVDETVYDWTLDWNSLDNIATFTVEGNSINYDFDLSSSQNLNLDKFNAFGIQARADDPDSRAFITEGTEITLNINSMTFNSNPEGNNNSSVTDNPNLSVSAISDVNSPNIFHEFYTINAGASELNSVNSEITSMSGTFSMDIPDGGVNPQDASARSRIGFQVLLFDPPAQSVPESAPILSLLGLGALSLRKRIITH